MHKLLESNYPKIVLALFDSDASALQAVATGQADAYIGNLTVASHIIHREGLSHLKVAAAGAAGGYLYDRHTKSEEKAYQEGYKEGQKKSQ